MFSQDRSPWWLCAPLVIYGLGGLASAQLTNVVLEDVPPEASVGLGRDVDIPAVGCRLGSAILGAVLFTGLGVHDHRPEGVSNLPADQQAKIVDTVKGSAGQYIVAMEKIPQLGPEVQAAKEGYTSAARDTAFTAALFIFFGLLVSFGLPKDSVKEGIEAEPEAESDADDQSPRTQLAASAGRPLWRR